MGSAPLCGGCGCPVVPGLACCASGARKAAAAKAAAHLAANRKRHQPNTGTYYLGGTAAPPSATGVPMPFAGPVVSSRTGAHPAHKPTASQVPGASQVWRTHANHRTHAGQYTRGIARTTTLLRK